MTIKIPATPALLGFDAKQFPAWRPNQLEAIKQTLADLTREDITVDAIGEDLPVGSGKSLYAVTVVKLYLQWLEKQKGVVAPKGVILTGTKALQDQYVRDFPKDLTDMRGMANYECHAINNREFTTATIIRFHPDRRFKAMCDVGPCLLRFPCQRKEAGCGYFDQLKKAKAARMVVTNYAYWILGALGGADIVVCDEAHLLRSQLDSAAKLSHPDLPKAPLDATREWALAKVRDMADKEDSIAKVREMNTLSKLANMQGEWVRDEGWKGTKADNGVSPSWSPVVFHEEGDILANSATKFVLTSGTLTEDHVVTFRRATTKKLRWTYYTHKSTFPVTNRRVLLCPAILDGKPISVKANWGKDAEEAHIKHCLKVTQLMQPEKRKGIVHAVSYARAKQYYEELKKLGYRDGYELFFPKYAREIRDAIEAFKGKKVGGVIVSPSLTTGHDFPQELCRWQQVLKVPFPDTRSPLVQARMKLDRHYGTKIAMETLAQIAGRGSRSQDDWVETYVHDANLKWACWVPGVAPRTLKEAYMDIGNDMEGWLKKRGQGR